MVPQINYSERFQHQNDVDSYECGEYDPHSYSSFIWGLQRPVLRDFIGSLKAERGTPVRLLDFACGTGRIISSVETLVDEAEGIDISEKMLAVARGKCKKARLRVGDILSQSELLKDNYDIITCFRFLLNVEPEIRLRALRRLRQALQEPDGRLIVSVHGNARSLRHPAIVWKRWRLRRVPAVVRRETMLNEMSVEDAEKLLDGAGFMIEHRWGFGITPPTVYRTPLRRVAAAIDRYAARQSRFTRRSVDLVFVCRPR
jgi:SAM-dependent methyltransferase